MSIENVPRRRIAICTSPCEPGGYAATDTMALSGVDSSSSGQPHASTFCIYQKTDPCGAELHCDFIFVNDDLAPRVRDLFVDQKTQASDHQPVVLTLGGQRTGRMMRWDLVPWRNHGEPTGKVLINAKVENLETNYYWMPPWQRGQRCIFTMAGFYEPHKFQDGRKEPFYVHLVDREMFGVAGLWDR